MRPESSTTVACRSVRGDSHRHITGTLSSRTQSRCLRMGVRDLLYLSRSPHHRHAVSDFVLSFRLRISRCAQKVPPPLRADWCVAIPIATSPARCSALFVLSGCVLVPFQLDSPRSSMARDFSCGEFGKCSLGEKSWNGTSPGTRSHRARRETPQLARLSIREGC
jgi:hypothetical protein